MVGLLPSVQHFRRFEHRRVRTTGDYSSGFTPSFIHNGCHYVSADDVYTATDTPSPTNETSKLQCSSVVFMVEVMIRTTPTHTANPAMKIPTYTPTFVETMVGSPTKTRVGSAGS